MANMDARQMRADIMITPPSGWKLISTSVTLTNATRALLCDVAGTANVTDDAGTNTGMIFIAGQILPGFFTAVTSASGAGGEARLYYAVN